MIEQKAEELGRLIGQSPDYKAYEQVRGILEEAQELHHALNRMEQLAQLFQEHKMAGKEPPADETAEYERLLSLIQSDSRYQQLVAAQANFDKLMLRVNQHIMEGVTKGASSRIITLD